MKIIAFYLPQYHTIPENSMWWEEDFTEWANVKRALPLYEEQFQPRIPLNNNYYNLLDDSVKIWQADLAQKFGIYGFCYYHYWFSGKLLLEKPMEQMLKNKNIKLPFCICWANESWSNSWVGGNKILIEQKSGDKDEWLNHFNYLLPFFKDERYIKDDDGKLLFVIYRPENIDKLNEMLDYWQDLAKKNDLLGFSFAYQQLNFDLIKNKDDSRFKYNILFEPQYSFYDINKNKFKLLRSFKRKISTLLEKSVGYNLNNLGKKYAFTKVSYDESWQKILNRMPKSNKDVPCAFVNWDNTPRHGIMGRVYNGFSCDKFEKNLSELIIKTRKIYNKDFMFINAWNEWGEGAYLEPDTINKYKYLQSVKNAIKKSMEIKK